MELLKINTAGSVDDGKSTLIGRFLYDNNALTIEQEELVRKKTKEKGLTDLDFSVITDGLIAEREQGITIDVAHIYFSSLKRKFIIADSPGHEEYTRNMVTGASNSEVSIILIDARKGLLPQTRRHYFISRLLQLETVLFCINKMDLVDYSEDVFLKIASDLDKMIQALPELNQATTYIPISSLKGDNVVHASQNMKWFQGSTLSQVLHDFEKTPKEDLPFRMDIQQVFHVQNEEFVDFRSYAGTVISGEIKVGDIITVLPSKKKSKVVEIIKYKDTLIKASQGNAIQIKLEDEIDISRGMLLTKNTEEFLFSKEINCQMVWLEESVAISGSKYLLQVGTRNTICKIKQINSVINPVEPNLEMSKNQLALNDIGNVTLQLANPVFMDAFQDNKPNGAFILVDSTTNNTVAVGFVCI